jgi:dipeptidyl aminopeptidase/acylaminoacyl peptidase
MTAPPTEPLNGPETQAMRIHTTVLLCLALAGLGGCRKPAVTAPSRAASPTEATAADPALPPGTPGLELQEEDYARVRAHFRTKLLRKGPAPQRWDPVRPPAGVTEVTYRSGDLMLKAWVQEPADKGQRHPAVLFLHGGWAFGEDDWEQAQPLRDAGFVVLTPLLRGENGQPGHFTMFYDEVDDVLAAADYLAGLPYVDPSHVYVAGHSAGGTHALLAAMASDRFRAAASLSASPDRVEFVRGGWQAAVPFDQSDVREFRVRSPVAYAASFKCPARLYVGSREVGYQASTRRTALLARGRGLDVEAVVVPGDHWSAVPEALRQAVEFFRQQ